VLQSLEFSLRKAALFYLSKYNSRLEPKDAGDFYRDFLKLDEAKDCSIKTGSHTEKSEEYL